jgi:tRNA-splicing ligase RtcB (3'-phosphate/5'-hydroxy nucleic acid ligase)
MDTITGKHLKLNDWPDGRIIGIAKRIGESPQAYKPIESVITAQHELVDVIGKFMPPIVRMADEAGAF